MKPTIGQFRCGVLRECGNNQCMLKMLSLGYKTSPKGEVEKNKNAAMERQFGKGFYPAFQTTGRDDFVDVTCPSFREKR